MCGLAPQAVLTALALCLGTIDGHRTGRADVMDPFATLACVVHVLVSMPSGFRRMFTREFRVVTVIC